MAAGALMRMARGEQVEVNPGRFKIVDGKLLLFYDGLWGQHLE